MASLADTKLDAQVTALRRLYAAYIEILRATGKYDPQVLPAAPLPPSGDSPPLARLYELLDEAYVGLRATGYSVPTTWQSAHPNAFVKVARKIWGAVRDAEGELLATKTEQHGGERRPYLLSDLLDDLQLDQHCRKNAAFFCDVDGSKRRAANFAKRDVKRIATICTAREGDFTVVTLRKQCAIAAGRNDETLEEFLKLDVGRGADLLQAVSEHEAVSSNVTKGSGVFADAGEANGNDLDRKFMERAVEEARKSRPEGDNRVHPKVGVVVVKDGKELVVAHRGEQNRGEHAEFTAMEKKLANVEIAGATVYTTLEPCTSRKHPKVPCADRLIERKVKRVVIGMHDPNPTISGKGFLKLREASIAVDLFPPDLMSKIEEMNREFIRHHKNASPNWVRRLIARLWP